MLGRNPVESDDTTKAAEVFAIGIGECGSNIVGSYLKRSKDNRLPSRVRGYLLINTDRADLTKVRQKYEIPKEHTLLYGASEIGVGGRFMDGYNAVMESKDIIFDQLGNLGFEGVSGFCIFTSLGGGTGCGGTPALIDLLKQRFQEEEGRRIFVYVIGVLPFEGQSSEALNSIWAVSKLLRAQLQERGADLTILLSNRTMLKRILQWRRSDTVDYLQQELNVDIANIESIETMVPSTIDEGSPVEARTEQAFVELVNPLALDVVEAMLSPGVWESHKDVFPTTDLADYARKLDPVVVPALYQDVGLIDDQASMPKQLKAMIEYAVKECSYADVGEEPNAESVYYVMSGPRNVAKAEYGMHLKEALDKFIAPGAAITPCYVQYHTQEPSTNLLLLLGLPKIPELVQIINEATQLVNLHSGASPLKQGWFMRSKGTTRKELVDAINDFRELFSYYMTPGDTVE
ncbi:MAG: hypothetical protein DRO87_05855 [Candidatus Thorarchaeota archaeon]|nr:MAG: hypothetical protein DRP09_00260 [Candidatus Thorarchaeota archaeon]RLI58391.1 MAG: hypothetical protein DRO87_05855 [Candidatus Thorarchaeota archaeon]